ncbi:MAG: DUF4013 domain-containing protein [Pirellulaceae bacterium]|nr:DUF4013 domain-containing protein [Pirellulaceae bacterium]
MSAEPEPRASEPPSGDPPTPPAAKPPTSAPLPGTRRIEYLAAVRIVFSHPDWVKNVLLVGVFSLIPVLSVPFLLGYLFEVTEMLHRRAAAPYPLFEIRRYDRYVTRGIWAYLVTNIVGTVLGPVLNIVLQLSVFGIMAATSAIQSDPGTGTIIVAIIVTLLAVGLLMFLLVMMVILTPVYLRAGLTQDFAGTFKFRWWGDFLRRVWLETLLVNLFSLLASGVLITLGCAVLCVGVLFTGAIASLMAAHLNWQLYELYLARGGEPIPLKPLPADVPPVLQPGLPIAG